MIRLVIVDDHPLVRGGIATLVASSADITVVGEGADGQAAVDLAVELSPDVVLMDLSMPGVDGIEATRRLLVERPGTAVVMLTSFHDRARVGQAVEAGAIGYLLKDGDPADLLSAIRSAAVGHSPLDPRVARALLPMATGTTPAPSADGVQEADMAESLSVREAQVLRLIMRGYTNRQIGHELGIAERTVKVHVGHLFRRIGVGDRTSAAMWARDNLPAEPPR